MKDHEASITFHQKTWQQACLVFMLSTLKKATAKTYFLHYDTRYFCISNTFIRFHHPRYHPKIIGAIKKVQKTIVSVLMELFD